MLNLTRSNGAALGSGPLLAAALAPHGRAGGELSAAHEAAGGVDAHSVRCFSCANVRHHTLNHLQIPRSVKQLECVRINVELGVVENREVEVAGLLLCLVTATETVAIAVAGSALQLDTHG